MRRVIRATIVAADVLAESGVAGLTDMTVELSLKLASALGRITGWQDMAIRVSRPSPSPMCGSWTDQRVRLAEAAQKRVSTAWCPVASSRPGNRCTSLTSRSASSVRAEAFFLIVERFEARLCGVEPASWPRSEPREPHSNGSVAVDLSRRVWAACRHPSAPRIPRAAGEAETDGRLQYWLVRGDERRSGLPGGILVWRPWPPIPCRPPSSTPDRRWRRSRSHPRKRRCPPRRMDLPFWRSPRPRQRRRSSVVRGRQRWMSTMDYPRCVVPEAVMAVLSDDHNAEVGEAVLRELVAGVALTGGTDGLSDLAVELALKVAQLVERIATEEGLAAVDLMDVLFVD